MKTFKLLLILFISQSVITPLFSQTDEDTFIEDSTLLLYSVNENPGKFYNTWSVSGYAGGLMFYGDIRDHEWIPSSENIKTGLGFSLNKTVSPLITLKGNILKGDIRCSDSIRYFESSILEGTFNGEFNISNMINPNKFGNKYYFFADLGIGLSLYNSVLKNIADDSYVSSQGYTDNGTKKESSKLEVIVPVGVGIKGQLTRKIDISLQTTLTKINTDYLDSYKANVSKDKYNFTSIGITYHIGKKEKNLAWLTPYELLMTDSDADGVVDLMDKEQHTLPDAPTDGAGIALDGDNDGIPDLEDLELHTPKGCKVNSLGIALDKDKDGVPDGKDKEPNTPKGVMVNFQGMSLEKGLTEIENAKTTCALSDSLLSMVVPSVYFGSGSATVSYANTLRMASIAKIMHKRSDISLEVIGFADKSGSPEINRELSKLRAEAVLKILNEQYLVPKDRLFINFFGDTKPLGSGKSDAVNRRVDFMIIKNN